MQPTPSSPTASSRSGSIQRFSIEYDGWWMRSGVPRSRRIARRLARLLRRVGRDPRVQRLALPDGGVERAHRLLERRLGVEAVGVEDVDVVEAHAREALVEAREQVLARSATRRTGPATCRSRPSSRRRARRGTGEVLAHERAEGLLGRAVRRAVVVREVEVRDAEVERAADDRAARLERRGRGRSSTRGRARSPGAAGRCGRSGGRACGRSGRRRGRTCRGEDTGSDPWGLTHVTRGSPAALLLLASEPLGEERLGDPVLAASPHARSARP